MLNPRNITIRYKHKTYGCIKNPHPFNVSVGCLRIKKFPPGGAFSNPFSEGWRPESRSNASMIIKIAFEGLLKGSNVLRACATGLNPAGSPRSTMSELYGLNWTSKNWIAGPIKEDEWYHDRAILT